MASRASSKTLNKGKGKAKKAEEDTETEGEEEEEEEDQELATIENTNNKKKAAKNKRGAAAAASGNDEPPKKRGRGRPPKPHGTTAAARKKAEKMLGNPTNTYFDPVHDKLLCIAFLSASEDPIVGTNNSSDEFWMEVFTKFQLLFKNEDETKGTTMKKWTHVSMKNRWQKKIQPTVNVFNAYYRNTKKETKSGWSDEDYIQDAITKYEEKEGKEFGYRLCCDVLWKSPKFDPINVPTITVDDDDGTAHNNVGAVMGASMERPMGNKGAKAKHQSELVHRHQAQVRTDAMARMADANQELALTMATRQQSDMDLAMAQMYTSMGDTATAAMYLQNIKTRQAEAAMRASNFEEDMNRRRAAAANASYASTPTAGSRANSRAGTPVDGINRILESTSAPAAAPVDVGANTGTGAGTDAVAASAAPDDDVSLSSSTISNMFDSVPKEAV